MKAIFSKGYNIKTTKIIISTQNNVLNEIYNYWKNYYINKKIQKVLKTMLYIDTKDMKYVALDFNDIQEMNQEQALYFICLDEGHLIGVLKYYFYTNYTYKNPCFEYISINPNFKHQQYGTALLDAGFKYHKEHFSNKILFITEFSNEGKKYAKNVCQRLALKYNVDIFGTKDLEHFTNQNTQLVQYDFKPTEKIKKILTRNKNNEKQI